MDPRADDLVVAWARLAAVFDDASARTGVVERRITVAGRPVLLRFAGEGMEAAVMPAFGHLPATTAPPELTVQIWDSASSGTRLPALPMMPIEIGSLVIPALRRGALSFAYQATEKTASMLDSDAAIGLFAVADAAAMHGYERGSPLRAVLNWWLEGCGTPFVHSAAVARAGRPGVMLTGRGGSGKSTTSVACQRAGLAYAGDDYVAVTIGAEGVPPSTHSLYRSAKLDRRHAFLLPSVANPGESDKAVGFLDPVSPGFPLAGVVLPRVTGSPGSSWTSTSAGRALFALGPASVLQLPGGGEATFHTVAALARRLPCFRLELGTELDGVVTAMEEILEKVAG